MEEVLIFCGVIATAVLILNLSAFKDRKSMIKHYDDLTHYLEKKVDEKDEINEINLKLLRETYSIIGDTFHYLHYMFEKGPCNYIPLITVLGEYLRRMWISSNPLSDLSDKFDLNPDQKHLPCLDDDENRQMLTFLKEIKDGNRNPIDLLRLTEELTDPEKNFKQALTYTEAIKSK